MKEKVFQKICRECYTTTPHKVVEVTYSKTVRKYEKIFCLKCSEAKGHKKVMPKKTVSYENFLEL